MNDWKNGLARREVLAGLGAVGIATRADAFAPVGSTPRVRPGQPGWPSAKAWETLGAKVGGRLGPVTLPEIDPARAKESLSNPFFIRDQAGLTQSSGFVDGWRSAPSVWVVRARSAADVSAAVRFAAAHHLRLVVKGGGHSYLGGSNAPDSLLVWTRDMDDVVLHDAFTPAGSNAEPVPAVSLGAGCIWLEAYRAVTVQGVRYVQGGGCTTVGVAGLVQGGGFGSFSKTFGVAAASLLEAEIVTADGVVRVVNAAREPDLFWALKGGGGGTFGIVTRMTLRTHVLPSTFGVVIWSVKAASDEAFARLLERFLGFYAERLFNPHWGEQARANHHNELSIQMLFQGLTETQARETWREMAHFVNATPADFHIEQPMIVAALPAQKLWDTAFLKQAMPSMISIDNRPGSRPDDYYWRGNTDEAGAFWHGYTSAWLPASLLSSDERPSLAKAWFDASRHWSVAFHFNKGLAGGAPDAIAASRDTAMNPQVLDAFALAIIADDGPSIFAPFPAPDIADARADNARIHASMTALLGVAPGAGSYFSESDYALKDWQQAYWGEHWRRLARVKRHYDPTGFFHVHHGVGSEVWADGGFTISRNHQS